MEKHKCLLFGLLLSLCLCDGYKILTVFPIPSPSHGILGDNVVKHLLKGGHEVTYITPFKKLSHPNLRLVDVSSNQEYFRDKMLSVDDIMSGNMALSDTDVLFNMMVTFAKLTVSNPNVQQLLKNPNQKFDVIIGEYMFSDLYSSLPAVLQCPFIWFSTIEPHWMILSQVDGPPNPAYVAEYISTNVAPYSFKDRVHELWILAKGLYQNNYEFYYKEEEIYLEYIAPIAKEQGKPVPSYYEIKYNASLLLGNSQVAVGSAIALPPIYKHVGGYHIEEEVKPLPEDLKKIMDNAKNGVIYFSLGSNLKSKDLPEDLKLGLLKVLGNLKHTVIWKFEENLPNLPKNIHIVQWAPQQSILDHPNMILFVTHGGLLSVTEAICFGVPLIAIPFFADQFLNANKVEKKGYGLKVDLTYHLHEDLQVALEKVLGDLPKYKAKAKELSVAYHDSPMKPGDAINFWVEHVVRTRGATHLRSIALTIPLYQKIYLDLLALVLAASIIICSVVKRVISLVTSKKNTKLKKN